MSKKREEYEEEEFSFEDLEYALNNSEKDTKEEYEEYEDEDLEDEEPEDDYEEDEPEKDSRSSRRRSSQPVPVAKFSRKQSNYISRAETVDFYKYEFGKHPDAGKEIYDIHSVLKYMVIACLVLSAITGIMIYQKGILNCITQITFTGIVIIGTIITAIIKKRKY